MPLHKNKLNLKENTYLKIQSWSPFREDEFVFWCFQIYSNHLFTKFTKMTNKINQSSFKKEYLCNHQHLKNTFKYLLNKI